MQSRGVSVCSRIIRLMNNQTKSQRKATIPTKKETAMSVKKDLISAELETVRISKSPTTVVTANGEVLTKEGAITALVMVIEMLGLIGAQRCVFCSKSISRFYEHRVGGGCAGECVAPQGTARV